MRKSLYLFLLCYAALRPAYALDTPMMEQISASESAAMAVDDQGRAWAWGNNRWGQLCLGSTGYQVVPRVIDSTPVKAVLMTNYTAYLLGTDGQVRFCGLKNPEYISQDNTVLEPTLIPELSGIQALDGEANFVIALDAQGEVWVWGSSTSPGNAVANPSMTPKRLGLSNVAQIAAGRDYALALKTDGSLWGWGDNQHGQLAHASTELAQTSVPVQLPIENVVQIAAGRFTYQTSAALKADNTVWVWGQGAEGLEGTHSAPNDDSSTALQVQGLPAIKEIYIGGAHLFALDQDQRLWTWGWNMYGQMGIGADYRDYPTPQRLNAQLVYRVGAGSFTSFLRTNDGQFFGWGINNNGQVGAGTYGEPYNYVYPTNVLINHDDLKLYRQYMPMGEATYFTSSEFVPLLNTSNELITGIMELRFSDGSSEEFSFTVPAQTRSGVTLTGWGRNRPAFSSIIYSNKLLDASFVHYDSGKALGENYTDTLSPVWTISERAADSDPQDRIYVYNPSDSAVLLNVQFSGTGVTQTQVGWSIPPKRPITIDVQDFFSGNEGQSFAAMLVANEPVVAALAHYENNLGTLRLLQPNLGNSIGYNAEGWAPAQGFENINLYNPGSFNITPSLIVNYNSGDNAEFVLPTLAPQQSTSYPLSDYVRADEGYSITYRAVATEGGNAVVEMVGSFTHADNQGLNGTPFITTPKSRWTFAEGFRHKVAENVREYLLMYNPTSKASEVKVRLFYDDARTPTLISLTVPAGKKSGLALHEHPQVEVRNEENSDGIWYGSEVISSQPIVVYFTHYDIKFGGSFAF